MSQCQVKLVTYCGSVQPGGEKWYPGFWVYMLPATGYDKYSNKNSVVSTAQIKINAKEDRNGISELAAKAFLNAAKPEQLPESAKPAREFVHAQLLASPISLN